MDILDIGASRSYTKKSLVGLGALKGAPCIVSDVQEGAEETVLTLKWTGTDGSSQTRDIRLKNGADGEDAPTITTIEINPDNSITCVMSDGSTVNSSNSLEIDAGNVGYTTGEDASVSDVKDRDPHSTFSFPPV